MLLSMPLPLSFTKRGESLEIKVDVTYNESCGVSAMPVERSLLLTGWTRPVAATGRVFFVSKLLQAIDAHLVANDASANRTTC